MGKGNVLCVPSSSRHLSYVGISGVQKPYTSSEERRDLCTVMQISYTVSLPLQTSAWHA